MNTIWKREELTRKHKKNVNIPTPEAVREYNLGMGGTDCMDQNINAYRVSVRGKKWWWFIFTWLLDAS